MKGLDITFYWWWLRKEDALDNAFSFLLALLHAFVKCSLKLRCSSIVIPSSFLIVVFLSRISWLFCLRLLDIGARFGQRYSKAFENEGGRWPGTCSPIFLRSKKTKVKQRKTRKSFKPETIKRLSPRSKYNPDFY